MQGLKVGEVAKQAAVNLHTIHFYERKGLLPNPPRTASNYRMYSGDAVRRVRFVKRAQELGFCPSRRSSARSKVRRNGVRMR